MRGSLYKNRCIKSIRFLALQGLQKARWSHEQTDHVGDRKDDHRGLHAANEGGKGLLARRGDDAIQHRTEPSENGRRNDLGQERERF